jgi:hypothetical protein
VKSYKPAYDQEVWKKLRDVSAEVTNLDQLLTLQKNADHPGSAALISGGSMASHDRALHHRAMD